MKRVYRVVCQRVTAVSTNDIHQIQIPWLLITAICQHSLTALYPCTPPVHPLSGLKHSMLTYLTHLSFVYLPVAPVFLSPFSTAPVLYRLHAPLFLLDSLEKEKDIIIPRLLTWTFCSSHFSLLLLNKPFFVLHLPLCPVSICWQKTRPEPTTRDGVPEPRHCGSPRRAGQRSSNSSLSGHTPSVCLCQSHGHPWKLFGWGDWM